MTTMLLPARRALRSRLLAAIAERVPSLRRGRATVGNVDWLFELLVHALGNGGLSLHAAPDLARAGAAWARLRCARDDLLAAYRTVVDVLVDFAGETGNDPQEIRDTVELVLTVCAAMAAGLACGYHGVADGRLQQAEFVRDVLSGTLRRNDLAARAVTVGVDPAPEYRAFRARPAPGTGTEELAQACGFAAGRTVTGGVCAWISGDLVGFLAEPPDGPVPGVCGLGPPRPLDDLAESYRLASRALDTAGRCGLTGVVEFDRLGLLPAVRTDRAVGEALCRRYLAPLGDSPAAEEVVQTLRAYLAHGMNAGRTAVRMFVHPNTIRYRIGRFEELAGVSLHDDPVAMFEVLWALEYRRLSG